MKIVVTGGSGFVGSHVVEELRRRGHDVAVFDARKPERGPAVDARFLPGDLASLDDLAGAFRGMDAVCHLAGVGDVYLAAEEPYTAARANVVGTTNVAEAACRAGLGKVVYASTWEVYGTPQRQPIDEEHPCAPDHPYNITKYGGELMALSYDHLKGLPVLALRLGTAYGLRMRPNSVFSLFIDRAARGEPIVIQGTGEQTRQFTHARDIARAFALACESSAHGMALNTVAERSISVRELAEAVCRRLPTEIQFAPARSGDIAPAIVSSRKAEAVLGWKAEVDFDDGVAEQIAAATADGRPR